MDAAIVAAGFTAEQRSEVGLDPAIDACPAAIVITFRNGKLTININGTDEWGPGPYRIVDDQTFEAGDGCDFCVQYRFQRVDDELRIDVVNDEDPGGLEDFIVQTAILESVVFERVIAL